MEGGLVIKELHTRRSSGGSEALLFRGWGEGVRQNIPDSREEALELPLPPPSFTTLVAEDQHSQTPHLEGHQGSPSRTQWGSQGDRRPSE